MNVGDNSPVNNQSCGVDDEVVMTDIDVEFGVRLVRSGSINERGDSGSCDTCEYSVIRQFDRYGDQSFHQVVCVQVMIVA